MPTSPLFQCPNCSTAYRVVRVEAPPGSTIDRELTCISCGGPLQSRDGAYVLKYFAVDRPKGHRRVG